MKKVVDFSGRSTIEQQAAEWLIRLDGDDALSSEELQELRRWLAGSPTHREELHRLAELWNNMNVLTELAVPLDHHNRVEQGRLGHWLRPPRVAAVTATIFVAVAIGLLILIAGESVVDSNGLYATAVGQQRSVALSDGSTVLLNTDSQIRVNYGTEFRDVQLLRGEARFSVASDREMPFRVAAGGGRIRAVGTAFSVYIQDGSVEVTVIEGSVALETISPVSPPLRTGALAQAPVAEPLIRELGTLRAGQVATISSLVDDESGQAEVLHNFSSLEDEELSRRLSWTEGVLLFSGEPLETVVREIGRYTIANIEFADPEVGAIRIGGRFPVGETETMFETLENTFGLRVTYLSEDHVVLSGGD